MTDTVDIDTAARLAGITRATTLKYCTPRWAHFDAVRGPRNQVLAITTESLTHYLASRCASKRTVLPGGKRKRREPSPEEVCPRCTCLTPGGQLCDLCAAETRGVPYYQKRLT